MSIWQDGEWTGQGKVQGEGEGKLVIKPFYGTFAFLLLFTELVRIPKQW